MARMSADRLLQRALCSAAMVPVAALAMLGLEAGGVREARVCLVHRIEPKQRPCVVGERT